MIRPKGAVSMSLTQITIILNSRESQALHVSALRELRRPKDQARYLLRQALRLGDSLSTPEISHLEDSHIKETDLSNG
jgi:hypothetical protein